MPIPERDPKSLRKYKEISFGDGSIIAIDTDTHGTPTQYARVLPDGRIVPLGSLDNPAFREFIESLGYTVEKAEENTGQKSAE